MKRSVITLIALLAALTLLVSCGDVPELPDNTTTDPADVTTDDSGENEDPPEVAQFEIIAADGTAKYKLVRSESYTAGERDALSKLVSFTKNAGVPMSPTTDWENDPGRTEYEILIGKTAREGKEIPELDRELLGKNGFVIKVIGTRILIAGGSDSATIKAAEYFTTLFPADPKTGFSLPENYVHTDSGSEPVKTLFNGNDLAGFELVIPEGNEICRLAAEKFRKELFVRTNILLDAPKTSSVANKKIVFSISGNSSEFKVSVKDGCLYVEGSERIGLVRGVRDWFASNENKAIELSDGESFKLDYGTVVTYEEFGAKGDGKTDDSDAIREAHESANKTGAAVFAREDAEYYIGGRDNRAVIMTDTDWSTAHIIIDDRKVDNVKREVFVVQSNNQNVSLAGQVTSLKAGQANIGVTLPGDAIVTLVNGNVMQYIRYGSNQDNGSAMTDVILVHADGSVDPSTPILWDFDALTGITYRLVEPETLSIKGGTITTVANSDPSTYNYYYRGIRIYRSNVVVDGLTHLVSGEGSNGAPYYGILIFNGCVNCEVKNCVLTPHKTYKTTGSAGSSVSMGTYDITVTSCLGFRMSNTIQTIDICNSAYWGTFASNYAKNIEFDGCSISRFDAHKGVYNVTLRNCELGHQGINLIGHGTATIEDCTVYSQNFVNLRSDYGSTWNGDLIIRNCKYVPKNGEACDAVIVNGAYTDNHYFGYTCYLPKNIVIEGLEIVDKSNSATPMLFANINKKHTSASYSPQYPMVITESVKVSDIKIASGRTLGLSTNKYMFGDLKIEFN